MSPTALPPHFGPNRRAFYAHPEYQRGWCPICRDLPIPASTDKRGRAKGGRYTCQRLVCKKAWALACQKDYHHARRQKARASGLVHGRAA